MSQFVFVLKLDPANGDPREQIRRATIFLEPGTFVRVHVGSVPAIPYGVPFVTQTDVDWKRKDLKWLFSSDDAKAVGSWQVIAREIDRA
jgi:hypothetical protein